MRCVLLLTLLVTACAEDDGFVVDLGVITSSFEADYGPVLRHPATAPAGTDVMVTAVTFGNDCTWARRTDVEVTGMTAVIRPYGENAAPRRAASVSPRRRRSRSRTSCAARPRCARA